MKFIDLPWDIHILIYEVLFEDLCIRTVANLAQTSKHLHSVFKELSQTNETYRVLEWFHLSARDAGEDIISHAAKTDSVFVLEWYFQRRAKLPRTYIKEGLFNCLTFGLSSWLDALDIATKAGSINAIKWLYEKGYKMYSEEHLYHAIRHGYIKVLSWLLDTYSKTIEDLMNTRDLPTYFGGIPIQERNSNGIYCWMVKHKKQKHNNVSYKEYIGYEMLSLAVRVFWSHFDSIELVDERKLLDIVKIFYERGFQISKLPNKAAHYGQQKCLEWLYGIGFKCDSNILDKMFNRNVWNFNHLTCIWLHSMGHRISTSTMDHIAKTPYNKARARQIIPLHILGYRCSDDIIDDIVGNGDIEMVKYLHEQNYSASKAAMDRAAAAGHLDIVKFLHENRKEGCNNFAYTLAALNNHNDVAKWLLENIEECKIYRKFKRGIQK